MEATKLVDEDGEMFIILLIVVVRSKALNITEENGQLISINTVTDTE
jgi:hypothetical protein